MVEGNGRNHNDTSGGTGRAGRRRMAGLLVAGAVFVAGGLGVALATPPSGVIIRTEVAEGRVTDSISIQSHAPVDFHVQQLTIDPGADSGWHAHPGPEVTVVKSGSVTLIKAPGCQPRTYQAGEGFFVAGGVNHLGRNDSDEPAELWVTYTLPADADIRIDQPEGCEEVADDAIEEDDDEGDEDEGDEDDDQERSTTR